jgi:hypothetical protein
VTVTNIVATVRLHEHGNAEKCHQEDFQDYLKPWPGNPLRQAELKIWLVEAGDKGLHLLVDEFFTASYEKPSKLKIFIIRKAV